MFFPVTFNWYKGGQLYVKKAPAFPEGVCKGEGNNEVESLCILNDRA